MPVAPHCRSTGPAQYWPIASFHSRLKHAIGMCYLNSYYIIAFGSGIGRQTCDWAPIVWFRPLVPQPLYGRQNPKEQGCDPPQSIGLFKSYAVVCNSSLFFWVLGGFGSPAAPPSSVLSVLQSGTGAVLARCPPTVLSRTWLLAGSTGLRLNREPA